MKSLLFVAVLFTYQLSLAQNKHLTLWYRQPAAAWTEALPVGNGRMGAMVYGDYRTEHLQLNEESFWAGSKVNNNNPEALGHLAEIRDAVFRGDYRKAEADCQQYLVGTPPNIRSYQPMGDLFIRFPWTLRPRAYRRSLDLNTGIARTEYEIGGNKIVEEVFASAPDDILVVRLQTSRPIDMELWLSRELPAEARQKGSGLHQFPYENHYQSQDHTATLTGQIIDGESPQQGPAGKHMRYAVVMELSLATGQLTATSSDTAAGFSLRHSTGFTIRITGATDYAMERLDLDPAADPLQYCQQQLQSTRSKDFQSLKAAHVSAHRALFERVHFDLGPDPNTAIPTDERLAQVREGKPDRFLVPIYYQYGRYLLMGSSRKPGRLPANLQGVWNDSYQAPWNADFHTNINLQMNYWPAETGNLSETSVILSRFMYSLMQPGMVTARDMYGARGWTLHHLTDPFGRTGVMDGVWGITPMDGPWMTFPVFDHFEFTLDTTFLREVAYPLIRGSVEFVLDYLVRSPEGYWVTNPSHSPENSFYVPGTARKVTAQLTYAPTIDLHILNQLFRNFIRACETLNTDSALAAQVSRVQKELPPLQISRQGTLQEWIHDYEEPEPGHRHMSHLLGLYPLDLITPKDSLLFAAVRKSLEKRLASGGGHTGWSRAWIIGLYARLLEPEKSLENVTALLAKSTLPNLFDTHPPFQIDGNFGGTAGIGEMLLQSQQGLLHLLPALPNSWSRGSVQGLRGRGACTIDLYWENHQLQKAVIHSDKGGRYAIRYQNHTVTVDFKPGISTTLDAQSFQ